MKKDREYEEETGRGSVKGKDGGKGKWRKWCTGGGERHQGGDGAGREVGGGVGERGGVEGSGGVDGEDKV